MVHGVRTNEQVSAEPEAVSKHALITTPQRMSTQSIAHPDGWALVSVAKACDQYRGSVASLCNLTWLSPEG